MATMGFKMKYGNPEIRYLPEAASQSFAVGDLVYLVAGAVTIVADDATIFGVAAKAASTTTGTSLPVYIIKPDQTWAAQANATTAATNVGEDYELDVTSGSMYVNISGTTNPAVTIVDLDPRDGATTGAGGRVLVNFLPKVLQQLKGAGTSAL